MRLANSRFVGIIIGALHVIIAMKIKTYTPPKRCGVNFVDTKKIKWEQQGRFDFI
jgi:hypothetical protein